MCYALLPWRFGRAPSASAVRPVSAIVDVTAKIRLRSGCVGGVGPPEERLGRRRGVGNGSWDSVERTAHVSPHHSAPDSSVVRWDCGQPRRDAEEAQTEAAIGLTTTSEVSSERRVMSTVSESLSQLDVLVVDCQA